MHLLPADDCSLLPAMAALGICDDGSIEIPSAHRFEMQMQKRPHGAKTGLVVASKEQKTRDEDKEEEEIKQKLEPRTELKTTAHGDAQARARDLSKSPVCESKKPLKNDSGDASPYGRRTEAGDPLGPLKPVAFLRSLVDKKCKIVLSDDRVLTGFVRCFDSDLHILLTEITEYTPGLPQESCIRELNILLISHVHMKSFDLVSNELSPNASADLLRPKKELQRLNPKNEGEQASYHSTNIGSCDTSFEVL